MTKTAIESDSLIREAQTKGKDITNLTPNQVIQVINIWVNATMHQNTLEHV